MSGYRRGYEDNPGMEMLNMVNMFGGAMQRGQQIEKGRMEIEEEKGIQEDYDYFAKRLQDGDDFTKLENDPRMHTGRGYRAAVKLAGDRAQMGQHNLDIVKRASALARENYSTKFAPNMYAAQSAYDKGDMAAFAHYTDQASSAAMFPWKTQSQPDGTFKVFFRSNAALGFADTGRTYTAQEIMDLYKKTRSGESHVMTGADMKRSTMNLNYEAEAVRNLMETNRINIENALNPNKQITLVKNGKRYSGTIQNPLDYSQVPDVIITDESGRPVDKVQGNMLQHSGYRHFKKNQLDTEDGGTGKVGPNSAVHTAMLNAGYVWKPEQKWYFKAGKDLDGKVQIDLSQPASMETYNLAQRSHGGAAQRTQQNGAQRSGDTLGILRKQGVGTQGREPQRQAPSNIPSRTDNATGGEIMGPQEKPWNQKTIYDFAGDFNENLKNYKPGLPSGY